VRAHFFFRFVGLRLADGSAEGGLPGHEVGLAGNEFLGGESPGVGDVLHPGALQLRDLGGAERAW
jgi:hypothetical protein